MRLKTRAFIDRILFRLNPRRKRFIFSAKEFCEVFIGEMNIANAVRIEKETSFGRKIANINFVFFGSTEIVFRNIKTPLKNYLLMKKLFKEDSTKKLKGLVSKTVGPFDDEFPFW